MADRLTKEEQRWRAAIRARAYDKALAICRRVEPILERLVAESQAAPPPARANGSPSLAPPPGPPTARNGWVHAPALAHEFGVDTRTIKRQSEGQPFIDHISDRVTLVHRESYLAHVAARAAARRKPR